MAYGSGIFNLNANGSITVLKDCIININWSSYVQGAGVAGFMWIINRNNTDIQVGRLATTGYANTNDFRGNSASTTVKASANDVFRVGMYKSISSMTVSTQGGCAVFAMAI